MTVLVTEKRKDIVESFISNNEGLLSPQIQASIDLPDCVITKCIARLREEGRVQIVRKGHTYTYHTTGTDLMSNNPERETAASIKNGSIIEGQKYFNSLLFQVAQ